MTPASIDTEPVQRNKIVVSDRCGKGGKKILENGLTVDPSDMKTDR